MKTTVSEKKSVKTLKGQLFGALSMMLVAAIALGTSTYAWFVSNSTVEVSNMQLTVETSAYLQIAVQHKGTPTSYTEYKNLLATTDIINPTDDGALPGAGWTDMFTKKLMPASVTDATVANGTFFYSQGAMEGTELSTFIAATEVGEGGVKKIPLSFLSSTATSIFFGGLKPDGTTSITSMAELISETADTEDAKAQAALAAKALRIAVVPHNGTDGAVGTPVIFQFSEDATGGGYNTYYDKATGVDPVAAPADMRAYNSDALGHYAGVAAVFGADPADTAGMIQTAGVQTAMLTTNDYLATVTPGASGAAPSVAGGKAALFTLVANEPMDVDVYIWLEGVDRQCTVEMANYLFNLRLPFAAGEINTNP